MTWQELKHSKLAWSSSNLSKLTLTLILGVLPRKKMFYPETALCVYLRAKFQVSSLILTRPRRGDFTPSPLLSPQNEHLKKLTQIRIKYLITLRICQQIHFLGGSLPISTTSP